MELLIDTCILIWILEDSDKINANTKNLILNAEKCFVSSISIAEIEIKRFIGKIKIVNNYIDKITESGLISLAFDINDASGLGNLPCYHKDPFDRMLISQAKSKMFTILTSNTIFKMYNVQVLLNE